MRHRLSLTALSLMLVTSLHLNSAAADDAGQVPAPTPRNIPPPTVFRTKPIYYNMASATLQDLENDFTIECKNQTSISNGTIKLGATQYCWFPGLIYKHNDIWYGRANVTMRMTANPGLATAFVRGNEKGDEIDYEWVGKNTKTVQSTFFNMGIHPPERTKSVFSPASPDKPDLSKTFHTYTIDYKMDIIEWYINGKRVDAWANDGKPDRYPTNARELKINVWDAGSLYPRWAGQTDWTEKPLGEAEISALSFEPYIYEGQNTAPVPSSSPVPKILPAVTSYVSPSAPTNA
ncbi:CRH- protein [Tieghemiomyces parasiticus]|uniref:CRH- protein n=1 Tax=Tieghemiomyces parasiticus TaxID=78921 RepID=A0A9W8AFG5_9FUNG|nr:CRH- protein [Tieghemiomyces parasiticus]